MAEFFETQGGHEFYYQTMPKLARSVDELAKAVKTMCENTMPNKFTEPQETNIQMLRAIKDFRPEHFVGILSGDEVEYIQKSLQIEERTIVNLRNLRDETVMFFSAIESDSVDVADLISAVTGVIDSQIFCLGGEV